MIRYDLKCTKGHDFDGWFKSAEAFDSLSKAGHVTCTICGVADVEKRIMAPAVRPARKAGDMRRAIRLSGDFHLHIADHAGHGTLGRILRELVSRTSLILMTYSAPHSQAREDATACGCQEHRALLAALKLRDAREAARLMREHLERLESQLSFSVTPEAAPDLLELFGS